MQEFVPITGSLEIVELSHTDTTTTVENDGKQWMDYMRICKVYDLKHTELH